MIDPSVATCPQLQKWTGAAKVAGINWRRFIFNKKAKGKSLAFFNYATQKFISAAVGKVIRASAFI
jgi:hypothetical protein